MTTQQFVAPTRDEMNEEFRTRGYAWRRAEYVFAYAVPEELHPQDWLLVDNASNILALGDGPTRTTFAKAPSRDTAIARLAAMNIDDERRAELLAKVCPPPPAYPTAEAFYQTLTEEPAEDAWDFSVDDDYNPIGAQINPACHAGTCDCCPRDGETVHEVFTLATGLVRIRVPADKTLEEVLAERR